MPINEEEAKWLFSKLRNINFMQSLNLDNVDKLVKRIEKYSYPKGKAIIKEGQEGRALYIIYKGKVNVTKKKGLFGKINIADIDAGGFFGEMSLVMDSPCAATVTAVEPVEVFVLMKDPSGASWAPTRS